jgi:histone H3/H4
MGITIVDLDAAGKLLIIYSAFVKYLKKMGTQRISASAIYRLQESL